jgi:DNA-binding response OmpR family regulator
MSMERRAVLMAGGADDLQNTIRQYISDDYVVVAASAPKDALEGASGDLRYSLILICIDTPDAAAFDLLKVLTNLIGARDASVIFVTSSADSKAEVLAFRAGVADYIRMPVSQAVFKARIDARINSTAKLNISKKNEDFDAKAKVYSELREFRDTHAGAEAIDDKESRLHVINLNPIQDALATRWDRVEQKVIFVVDTTISSSLSHGEAYRYFGDNTFAVVYPTLTPAEGKIRVRALVEIICHRLLGEEFRGGRYGKDFVEKILTFDCVEEDEATQMREEFRRRQELEVKRKIISGISVEYIPIWDAKKHVMDGYRASFVREFSGQYIRGKNVLHGGNLDPLWPDLYAMMLRNVADKLAKIERNTPFIVITFDVSAVLSKNFIQKIDPELRKSGIRRNLYIELVGVDDDMNANTLKALIMMLKNFCSDVFVRVSAESDIARELKYSEIENIGINFSTILRSGLGRRAAYVVASHFAKKSSQQFFKHYAWDVDLPADFQVMSAAKFTRMSGNVFGESTTEPGPMRLLSPAMIMKSYT